MIFDRTNYDVQSAKNVIRDLIPGVELTDEQIEILNKGTLNVNTINRIEQTQFELSKRLKHMGYWNINIQNKEWDSTDWFLDVDFERIVENNKIIRKAFYVYDSAPLDAVAKYHYDELNRLERILFDVEKISQYVKENYKECGTFYCGE